MKIIYLLSILILLSGCGDISSPKTINKDKNFKLEEVSLIKASPFETYYLIVLKDKRNEQEYLYFNHTMQPVIK